jgi:hypothetical protein
MSSDFPNYGAVLAKNVKVDRSGLVFVDSTDDSKTVTLKLKTGALSAGNTDLTLPLSTTELGSGVPDGDTAGDVVVWSGSAWVQKPVSGDASLSSEGVLTIATNSIETAMLQDNCVNSIKIGPGQITSAKIANDAVTNSKISSDAVQALELGVTAGAATASRALVVDANSDVSGINELGLTTLAFGNNWRIQISGGGNMQFQYSSDGGSTWTTKQVFNNN